MNTSFKIALQIMADLLSSEFNKIPANVAIEEVAKKYNISKDNVEYICNEGKLSY